MKKTFALITAFALTVAFAGVAQAQAQKTYRWKDKAGNVQYGNVPPQGVHATPLNVQPVSPATSGGAGSAPLTPAQEQLQFRRRRLEQQKAEAKAKRERARAEARKLNCTNARDALRTLESGQRVVKINAKGERYFLSGAERTRETAQARQAVSQWCRKSDETPR